MTESSTPVPAYDSMLWPALVALREHGGSASNQEHLKQLRLGVKTELVERVSVVPAFFEGL